MGGGGGGIRREEKGARLSRMINFQAQVARGCSLKPVFPLAGSQSLLTFFLSFLPDVAHQPVGCDLSGWGRTSLEDGRATY